MNLFEEFQQKYGALVSDESQSVDIDEDQEELEKPELQVSSQKKREFSYEEDFYLRRPEACHCNAISHPPCSFCTDRNYCEECDEGTWDGECPNCGKVLI